MECRSDFLRKLLKAINENRERTGEPPLTRIPQDRTKKSWVYPLVGVKLSMLYTGTDVPGKNHPTCVVVSIDLRYLIENKCNRPARRIWKPVKLTPYYGVAWRKTRPEYRSSEFPRSSIERVARTILKCHCHLINTVPPLPKP